MKYLIQKSRRSRSFLFGAHIEEPDIAFEEAGDDDDDLGVTRRRWAAFCMRQVEEYVRANGIEGAITNGGWYVDEDDPRYPDRGIWCVITVE